MSAIKTLMGFVMTSTVALTGVVMIAQQATPGDDLYTLKASFNEQLTEGLAWASNTAGEHIAIHTPTARLVEPSEVTASVVTGSLPVARAADVSAPRETSAEPVPAMTTDTMSAVNDPVIDAESNEQTDNRVPAEMQTPEPVATEPTDETAEEVAPSTGETPTATSTDQTSEPVEHHEEHIS